MRSKILMVTALMVVAFAQSAIAQTTAPAQQTPGLTPDELNADGHGGSRIYWPVLMDQCKAKFQERQHAASVAWDSCIADAKCSRSADEDRYEKEYWDISHQEQACEDAVFAAHEKILDDEQRDYQNQQNQNNPANPTPNTHQ